MKKLHNGFTLIELLVVISIIVVLAGVSLFGLGGTRESARDARRKSDLELIRSGLELYKADCNDYPASISFGSNLLGDNNPASCSSSNYYITGIPNDPITVRSYRYNRPTATTYEICASLEQGTGSQSCNGTTCGTATCNYKVTNP